MIAGLTQSYSRTRTANQSCAAAQQVQHSKAAQHSSINTHSKSGDIKRHRDVDAQHQDRTDQKMRTHLKASKFVVVKAGTSTVSHDDGTPSLPRLGAIVEAVSQLMRQGTKVILVSSGAVGCGRSVLRKQAALHSAL